MLIRPGKAPKNAAMKSVSLCLTLCYQYMLSPVHAFITQVINTHSGNRDLENCSDSLALGHSVPLGLAGESSTEALL